MIISKQKVTPQNSMIIVKSKDKNYYKLGDLPNFETTIVGVISDIGKYIQNDI